MRWGGGGEGGGERVCFTIRPINGNLLYDRRKVSNVIEVDSADCTVNFATICVQNCSVGQHKLLTVGAIMKNVYY